MNKSRFYANTCLCMLSRIVSKVNLANSRIKRCCLSARLVRQTVAAAALLTGVSLPIHAIAADYTRIDAVTDTQPPMHTHDLAVVSIKAPKKVTLSSKKPTVVTTVKVAIQNRSAYIETIPDQNTLTNLVSLSVVPQSAGSTCSTPVAVLHTGNPQPVLPVTLKPNKTLKFVFDVTYACTVGPLNVSGHEDFHYIAQVDASALDGQEDMNPASDVCPRSPIPVVDGLPKDKGCGGKLPDKTLGGAVLSDIIVKVGGSGGGGGGKNTFEWGEWGDWRVDRYDALATEDFNGDGAIDILTIGLRSRLRTKCSTPPDSYCYTTGENQRFVRLYLQDALNPGTFLAAEDYPTTVHSITGFIDTGDLDQDGIPDVAGVRFIYGGSPFSAKSCRVEIFSQYVSGGGGFVSQEEYKTGGTCGRISIGDLNDDGLPDIAIGGIEPVLMINSPKSPGQSFSRHSFGDGQSINGYITVADINNDGRNDLTVTSGRSIIVYLQDSSPAKPGNYTVSGTYDTAPVAVGVATADIAVADLNNDSLPDLAVAALANVVGGESWVSVHIQDPLNIGEFLPASYYKGVGKIVDEIAIADLNNDLLPDIAISHRVDLPDVPSAGISILFQDPQAPGVFHPSVIYPSNTAHGEIALDDLNGDGLTDLVSFHSDETVSSFSDVGVAVYIRFQDINNPGTFLDRVVLP